MIGQFSGILKRKGAFFGMWTACFCEVKDSEFIIYKSKENPIIERKIEICSQTVAVPIQNHPKKFKIESPDEQALLLQAESEDNVMEWILAIKSQSIKDHTTTMDDFIIYSVLGRGFYGKVMLCQKKGGKELYAIKSIHKARLVKAHKVHTAFRERNVLLKIKHPFIVSLSFAFQSLTKFYLGLEYVPGGELFRYLQKRGPLTIKEARFYAGEIGLALSHLHSQGVIYRDLKPENVLLDEEGHIKLTDFGLAKDTVNDSTTNTFCGTAEYLAPEIIRKEDYSFAIDWWSYGCLVYEMCFGQTPFYDNNKSRIFTRIEVESPYFPPNADPVIIDFVSQFLIKDPAERKTFDQMKDHRFWNHLDFNALLNKQIKPEFVPIVDDKRIPDNFDTQFTIETPCDSLATPPNSIKSNQFYGFSFAGDLASMNDTHQPPISPLLT